MTLVVKNPPANGGRCKRRRFDLFPGLGRFSGGGNGNPLQYRCLENPMDRGVWQATVYEFARVGHDLATKSSPMLIVTN